MKKILAVLLLLTLSLTILADIDDEKKININLSTTLENSFDIISKISKVNIFLDESIPKTKNVKLKIENLTIREILTIILKLNSLGMEKINNNSIIIFPESKEKYYTSKETRTFYLKNANAKEVGNLIMVTRAQGKVYINHSMNSITVDASYDELEEIKKIIRQHDDSYLFVEKTYFLSYLNPKDALTMIQELLYVTKANINEKLNTLTVISKDEDIDKIDKLVEVMDIKPPQVVIEVAILDVSDTFKKNLGINWEDTLTVDSSTFTADYQKLLLPKSLIASETATSANVLSNPSVRVINNQTAKINVGERIPIVIAQPTSAESTNTAPNVEYKDVGIQLEVEPKIHLDNEVTIKLSLEVSSVGEMITAGDYKYPQTNSKNLVTTIRLKDGETAILGGLISNEERETVVKVPFLGNIPIVGSIFRKSEKTPEKSEIIMVITPRVITNIKNSKSVDYKYEYNPRTGDLLKKLEKRIQERKDDELKKDVK